MVTQIASPSRGPGVEDGLLDSPQVPVALGLIGECVEERGGVGDAGDRSAAGKLLEVERRHEQLRWRVQEGGEGQGRLTGSMSVRRRVKPEVVHLADGQPGHGGEEPAGQVEGFSQLQVGERTGCCGDLVDLG